MSHALALLRCTVLCSLVLGTVCCGGSSPSAPSSPQTPNTPTPTATRIIGLSGTLAFGSVPIGTTATAHMTITNSGNATLTVTGMIGPTGFSASWQSGTIAGGGSQAVTIGFTPTTVGSYSGTIMVSADHTGGTNTIAVSGTGTAPAQTTTRVIGLSGTLAFGNVPIGTTATAQMIITNTGNATLTVSGMTGPSGFSANWQSGTIAAGGSQSVTIGFTPTTVGSYAGMITVQADHTSGTNTITVSGTGTAVVPQLPQPLPTPTADTIVSNIDGTFDGWTGETVFALSNGQYWQQSSYAYVYHYAYRPAVVLTKVGYGVYKMSVEGVSQTISVQFLPYIVKSQIDGTFTGWTGETLFPLTNGQIWQQTAYAYSYHYAYRPDVLIYSASGTSYTMKVDGVGSTVAVKRIR